MKRTISIFHIRAVCRSLLCLSASVAPAFSQPAAEPSTAAVRVQREESPMLLSFEKDGGGSRVALDYSIRWDFSDLAHFRPGLNSLAEGISALGKWDITENTRVKYYGFRTNPWRLFLARERKGPAGRPGSASQVTAAGAGAPVYRKRVRLSLSPLVDDFKRNLDEELRSALLRNSLRAAGPQWDKTSTRNKKLFIQDVLSIGIWDSPVLDPAKEGLEYISK